MGNELKYKKEKQKTKPTITIMTEGGIAVGKSWLIKRYLNHELTLTYGQRAAYTIPKQITIDNYPIDITLFICDNPGNESFINLDINIIKSSNGILLVYDITDKNSFELLPKFLNSIKKLKNLQTFPVVLIGTKIDLLNQRAVEREVAQDFAEQHGLRYFEVSAQTGENVNEAIDYLIKEAYDSRFNY